MVAQKHALVWEALRDVERPLTWERSAKAIGEALWSDRFLVSFPRKALVPGPARHLRRILADLGAPHEGAAALDKRLSEAHQVHFGYELGAEGETLKCYLEFPSGPLRFQALKWRRGGAGRMNAYTDLSDLSVAERLARLDEILPHSPQKTALGAAMAEAPEGALLEVTEAGSARRSLDLTLYDLEARVGDWHTRLGAFLGASHVPFLNTIAEEGLGHMAAGQGRDGVPFATLYYGAAQMRGARP